MTPEEYLQSTIQPAQLSIQKPGFFQGLGQAFFPDQEGVDPAQASAARNQALLQFGLGTLAASQRPGAGFAESLFSGLGQASQSYLGAVQNAYANAQRKTAAEDRQRQLDRQEKTEARLDKEAARQDKKAEREDSQGRATTATRLAAGIKGAADPLRYLSLVGTQPEVQATLEEYGIDPATLTTPEAIQAAGEMLGQAGSLGIPYEKPERPAPLQLKAIIGPDGKPILVPEQEAIGKTPVQGRGLAVTLPDGTVISDGGPSGVGAAELSKPTVNKLQETIVNSGDRLDRINQTLSTYNREFLPLSGRFRAGATKLKEALGADPSPEDKQFLEQYSEFQANASRDISLFLQQLSGAAITPQEYERISKSAPSGTELSPTEFEAKAKSTVKEVTRSIMRANFALKNGIGTKNVEELSKILPLNAIDKVYEERANEIWQELGGTPEAKAEAVRLANQEFGLGR